MCVCVKQTGIEMLNSLCVCVWVCLLCQSALKGKVCAHCMLCCAAENSFYFALTHHAGAPHKYYLIKCVCARDAMLPVNLHTGRDWSHLSAARWFPPRFLWMKRGVFFFFFFLLPSKQLMRTVSQNCSAKKTQRARGGVGEE